MDPNPMCVCVRSGTHDLQGQEDSELCAALLFSHGDEKRDLSGPVSRVSTLSLRKRLPTHRVTMSFYEFLSDFGSSVWGPMRLTQLLSRENGRSMFFIPVLLMFQQDVVGSSRLMILRKRSPLVSLLHFAQTCSKLL